MASVQIITSKTKRGAEIKVAVIPQEMAPGLECHYRASEIAVEHGCTHWRVMTAAGTVYAAGKANSDARYGSFGPQG